MPTPSAIEIHQIRITKAQMAGLAANERGLMILAGHTLNVIGVWHRLAKMSSNKTPDNEIESSISESQTHILLRSLYGSLAEAWKWIKKNSQIIKNEYVPRMSGQGVAAYEFLCQHLDEPGILHKIRNKFAYHYPDPTLLETSFASVPEDGDWSWYIASDLCNSFWVSSELVMGYGTMGLTGMTDPVKGFRAIAEEFFCVSDQLQDFLKALLHAMLVRHFPDLAHTPVVHTVENAPSGREFWIPFYTDTRQDKEFAASFQDGVG